MPASSFDGSQMGRPGTLTPQWVRAYPDADATTPWAPDREKLGLASSS
jgi:hypothetical protein